MIGAIAKGDPTRMGDKQLGGRPFKAEIGRLGVVLKNFGIASDQCRLGSINDVGQLAAFDIDDFSRQLRQRFGGVQHRPEGCRKAFGIEQVER